MSLRAGVPIRDYVNQPKPNGYQSIHTNLRLPDGRLVEVQLRTRQMQPQYFPAEREEAEGGGVEEGEKPACTGMGAVVVGAGPIGLRSAIELALLGCGVVVLESRQARWVVQCMVQGTVHGARCTF